ncbi:MAG: response regulator, partial [Deltaproteobacteria bacterium]|nr:response regulator [Deltaproteobacteria bacterium]
RISGEVPAYVKGDPLRFRQVLLNLAGNAAKFTDAGEIEVIVAIASEEGNKIKLHSQVRDTGIGIPRDKLTAIFKSFQQADGSTTRRYGGTGLGLSICKSIAELMDGDVWAESEYGIGSTFHFSVWLERSEKRAIQEYVSLFPAKTRVLLVDDNRTTLNVLSSYLISAGLLVECRTRGDDVLAALQKACDEGNPFGLGIIDVNLPGGTEVADLIRATTALDRRIPLLALVSGLPRERGGGSDGGFDGYLCKPVRKQKLLQMVRQIIRNEQPENASSHLQPAVIQEDWSQETAGSVHILLAEDNPVNQKLATIMLKKAGYEVTVAGNGQEALDMYANSPGDYDLILMDVQMPGMDGLEATRLIRETGGGQVPIVAMTAQAMKGDRERCIKAGMNDYLSKPIKKDVVLFVVRKWTNRKEKTWI